MISFPFAASIPAQVPHRRSDFPDKKIETLNLPPFPNEILETVKAAKRIAEETGEEGEEEGVKGIESFEPGFGIPRKEKKETPASNHRPPVSGL
jgi:hypothetical protein